MSVLRFNTIISSKYDIIQDDGVRHDLLDGWDVQIGKIDILPEKDGDFPSQKALLFFKGQGKDNEQGWISHQIAVRQLDRGCEAGMTGLVLTK